MSLCRSPSAFRLARTCSPSVCGSGWIRAGLGALRVPVELRSQVAGDICSLAFDESGNDVRCFHHDGFTLLDLGDLQRMSESQTFSIGVGRGKRSSDLEGPHSKAG